MLDNLSLAELEKEVERRRNKGKGEEYEGFFLQESTYQLGHHVPGPRSPGEGYDYFTTEYQVEIRDVEGVLLKTVEGHISQAKIYIEHHLTPIAKEKKSEKLVEVEALEVELQQAKGLQQALKERVWELEKKYYDLRDFVRG